MNTIDLSFRPDTYWPQSLTPEQALSRIRGEHRQTIARALYESFGFAALDEFLVREGLAEEERTAWGAIGPWCMGGEYLPGLEAGEVEIARVSMASTTGDQISIRARPDDAHIRYRVVGEYEEEEAMRYVLPFHTSEEPLTLGRLVQFIDGAHIPGCAYFGGIFTCNWEMMYEHYSDADEIIGFLSLSSPFYDRLNDCYRDLAGDWLRARRLEDGFDLEDYEEAYRPSR